MYVAGLLTDWCVPPRLCLPSPFPAPSLGQPAHSLTTSLPHRRVVYVAPEGAGLPSTAGDEATDVYIGRSEHAMWMRVISSWLCVGLYLWSLYAPVLLPDRFGDI